MASLLGLGISYPPLFESIGLWTARIARRSDVIGGNGRTGERADRKAEDLTASPPEVSAASSSASARPTPWRLMAAASEGPRCALLRLRALSWSSEQVARAPSAGF